MNVGFSYPSGQSPVYPPRDWTCPALQGGCGKQHSKPHFPWPGQIDESKNPNDMGRVTFNRASKDGSDVLDESQPIKKEFVGKQAPMKLNDGSVQGLFCPHCGWKEDIINLIKVKNEFEKVKKGWRSIKRPNCCIQDCNKKSSYTKKKMNFCTEHYKLII